ncbi:hypothetical protein GUITHDRAFT_133913 [Guillardia theta CCMP2712]|uniref:Uncharacterized protein n=1 Tax=Guillardia theta (strain CCMP2712) TaxID=905079 RepID=L1JVF9_GUITC|nr:hypothetical protein GUITHDRAFT_133913 [Guillardia theta CCMP2712]EKX52195.1 hypothetical protein GUITHDRAFT_133913 [Guillardia theta CCMP2712]|eukprot:XP_005839175.1 hypothetical protein GUITHDRAFT_133913 [Guillardia theta CCMP2712]
MVEGELESQIFNRDLKNNLENVDLAVLNQEMERLIPVDNPVVACPLPSERRCKAEIKDGMLTCRMARDDRVYEFEKKLKLRALTTPEFNEVAEKVASDLAITETKVVREIGGDLQVFEEKWTMYNKDLGCKGSNSVFLRRFRRLIELNEGYVHFKLWQTFLEWLYSMTIVFVAPCILWQVRKGDDSDLDMLGYLSIVTSVLQLFLPGFVSAIFKKDIRCGLLVEFLVKLQFVVMLMDTLVNIRSGVTCINGASLLMSGLFVSLIQQANVRYGNMVMVRRLTEIVVVLCTIYACILAPVLSGFEKLALLIFIFLGLMDVLAGQLTYPKCHGQGDMAKTRWCKAQSEYQWVLWTTFFLKMVCSQTDKISILIYKPLPSKYGVEYQILKAQHVVVGVSSPWVNCSETRGVKTSGQPILFPEVILAKSVTSKQQCEMKLDMVHLELASDCMFWQSSPGCAGEVVPFPQVMRQTMRVEEVRTCLKIKSVCGYVSSCGIMGCDVSPGDRVDCGSCFTELREGVLGFSWTIPVPVSSAAAALVFVITGMLLYVTILLQLRLERLANEFMYPVRQSFKQHALDKRFLNQLKLTDTFSYPPLPNDQASSSPAARNSAIIPSVQADLSYDGGPAQAQQVVYIPLPPAQAQQVVYVPLPPAQAQQPVYALPSPPAQAQQPVYAPPPPQAALMPPRGARGSSGHLDPPAMYPDGQQLAITAPREEMTFGQASEILLVMSSVLDDQSSYSSLNDTADAIAKACSSALVSSSLALQECEQARKWVQEEIRKDGAKSDTRRRLLRSRSLSAGETYMRQLIVLNDKLQQQLQRYKARKQQQRIPGSDMV